MKDYKPIPHPGPLEPRVLLSHTQWAVTDPPILLDYRESVRRIQ